MDDKKQIKEFINHICDWIEYNLRVNGHHCFSYQLSNDIMAYWIADKGIERRIEKMLSKEFGLKSKVTYELSPSANFYLDGELRIKLLINNRR